MIKLLSMSSAKLYSVVQKDLIQYSKSIKVPYPALHYGLTINHIVYYDLLAFVKHAHIYM